MRLEMDLRRDPDFTRWVSDLLRSVLPQIQKLNFSQEALGDFDTLQKRLQDEVAAAAIHPRILRYAGKVNFPITLRLLAKSMIKHITGPP
jgi:hypothetical protein